MVYVFQSKTKKDLYLFKLIAKHLFKVKQNNYSKAKRSEAKEKMSQIKQRNRIYKDYERKIRFLQREGDALLQKIMQQETKMNRTKQQKLQPDQNNLYTLNEMIKKSLKMLSLIHCYRYFQARNEPKTDENRFWFRDVVNNYYLNTLRRFVIKLKVRVNELNQIKE